MKLLASILGAALLAVVLTDTFNTIVLPRRTQYGFRVTRPFYHATYSLYASIARHIQSGKRRESYLSVYGPLSLLILIGLWSTGIVAGFGLLEWGAGTQLYDRHPPALFDSMYLSATTLATLNPGQPQNVWGKLLAMAEGLLGLGFLGLNIGYLPTLYQSFSRRELEVSLLDGLAGSPPSAVGLIECEGASAARLERRFGRWEQWIAEMMENQLSYPMLAYFRSHHENQSWLSGLVAVVDAAAIVVTCAEGDLKNQAGLTFAIGRHTLADIAGVFHVTATEKHEDRLSSDQFQQVRERLSRNGIALDRDRLSERELGRLRDMYEPAATGLSRHLLMALPAWVNTDAEDNWKSAGRDNTEPRFTVSDPYKDAR